MDFRMAQFAFSAWHDRLLQTVRQLSCDRYGASQTVKSARKCDKAGDPKINLVLRSIPVQQIHITSVDSPIRAFLDGDTIGEDVLHDIYDQVLDEAVPERLLAVL